MGWGEVGKGEGPRAAPREKQHLHQWFDRALSQQGLGNCHPSQSCLWLSWLKTGSSQYCTPEPAALRCKHTAHRAAGSQQHSWMPSRQLQVSGKSHRGGNAGEKDQYSGSKPISRLYGLLITKQGGNTHTYPWGICLPYWTLIYWSVWDRGRDFTTLQHMGLASVHCMALALSRPYTLRLLYRHMAPAIQWGDQQFRNDSQREFCSLVKSHPVLLQEQ